MVGEYNSGIAGRVRRFLQEHGTPVFSINGVAGEIGCERDKVKDVVKDFLKAGEVRRVSRGRFQYVREGPFGEQALRAMHARGRFSVREISVLSDVPKPTIARMVNQLLDQEVILPTGEQRDPRGRREQMFRIRDRDGFFLQYVKGVK